jgi:hypothetical protein
VAGLVIAYRALDLPLPDRTASVVVRVPAGSHLILITDFPRRRRFMSNFAWLLTGGFAKDYRTQILGLITALSALASWAVGDATLADLVTKVPVIFGGLGLVTLGVKVNDVFAKQGGKKASKPQ